MNASRSWVDLLLVSSVHVLSTDITLMLHLILAAAQSLHSLLVHGSRLPADVRTFAPPPTSVPRLRVTGELWGRPTLL